VVYLSKTSSCSETKLPPPPPNAAFRHKVTDHEHIFKRMQDKWAETTTLSERVGYVKTQLSCILLYYADNDMFRPLWSIFKSQKYI